MKDKELLIASNHFYPYVGGLENYALQLATKLAAKGYDVTVVCFAHKKGLSSLDTMNGFTIARLPCWEILSGVYSIPKIFNKDYNLLMKNLKKTHYQAVFTNTRFFTLTWITSLLFKKRTKNLIHIEHGNSFVQHKNKLVALAARIADETLGRMVFRRSDVTIGISNKCSEFAKKLGAKKTTTIHNSINIEEIEQWL